MSRLAQPKTSPTTTAKRALPLSGAVGAADEICPICKSSRYLNANLKFLVNPECYHKLCSSCVDRIFGHGPAECPIPGCRRTLRKHRFREQTFEDIQVEREVDIRRRVAAVFNRREEEFEDLRSYNDYLNEVEDVTFNLINMIDLEATNRRFGAYQKAHEQEIEENAALAAQEKQSFSAAQKAERQLARQKRETARREEEEERRELEENRRGVLKRLAASDGSKEEAERITLEGQQRIQLKKRMDPELRQKQLQLQGADAAQQVPGVRIKGLKPRLQKPLSPPPPIDPFENLHFATRYFKPQEGYGWAGYVEAGRDVRQVAGGFDVPGYAHMSLVAAFSGLGVFVGEEVRGRGRDSERGRDSGRDSGVVDEGVIGTARADLGVRGDAKMADA